jgi:hypothetical protein
MVVHIPVVIDEAKWADQQHAEGEAPYPVMPDYPEACGALPPGARRKAVNVIYLLAHTLNLETCTPGLGVLLMDRYYSARKTLPSIEDPIILTAMICLNIAGKVADLDKGFCGSRGVIALVRDASPAAFKQPDHNSFARYVAGVERELLVTLEHTLLSRHCAMQVISELTNWNRVYPAMWARAAFICDVFCADSVSTRFMQTQIAKAIVGLLTSALVRHLATEMVVRALHNFYDTATATTLWADPYCGVRLRHSNNLEVEIVRKIIEKLV